MFAKIFVTECLQMETLSTIDRRTSNRQSGVGEADSH